MRTERFDSRLLSWAVPLLAAIVLPSAGPRAAQTEFRPLFSVGYFQDGNPRVVGENPQSESVTTYSLDLNFRSTSPTTDWTLGYHPSRETFSNSSFFDNTSHILSSTLRHRFSRKSKLEVTVFGAHTEQQVVLEETIQLPGSLVPRTTIDRAFVDASGEIETGARSFVTWRAGGGLARYEKVPGVDFQDSDNFNLGTGWGVQITRKTRIGVAYDFTHISPEISASTKSHSLGFTIGSQLGPKTRVYGTAGALLIDSEGQTDTTTSFDFRVVRTVTRGSNVLAGLRQLVSPGSGITGATKDQGGYVSWNYTGSRWYRAEVLLSFWKRETVVPGAALNRGTKGIQSSESWSWNATRRLGIGVSHQYTDQSSVGAPDPFNDTSYHTWGGFLRWNILGR